jgi:putative (di)nucleoside polyphosphate hydrolase
MTEDEILNLPYRPCVGIMLCNSQGGIFAGQRLDSAQDAWQMPQGGVEKDEDPKMPHYVSLKKRQESHRVLLKS